MLSRIRAVVWPERGFRRLFAYLLQRIARMPGSILSISIGAACGVAVSFTPFIGFHLLLGWFLAYLMRGNMLATTIGTIVGNPWTFPFILAADFKIGSWTLTQFGFSPPLVDVTFVQIIAEPGTYLMPLLMPLMMGGLVLSVIVWFASFGAFYWMLTGWRRHRAKRLAERRNWQRASRQHANEPTESK
jgi:uncharacterized protein (DUF2062 family)